MVISAAMKDTFMWLVALQVDQVLYGSVQII